MPGEHLIGCAEAGWESWAALLDETGAVPGLPSAAGLPGEGPGGHDDFSMPVATRTETAELAGWAAAADLPLGVVLLALLGRSVAAQEMGGVYSLRALLLFPGLAPQAPGAVERSARCGPLLLELNAREPLEVAAAHTWTAYRRAERAARLPAPTVAEWLGVGLDPGLVLAMPGQHAADLGAAELDPSDLAPGAHQLCSWFDCSPRGTFLNARHPSTAQCAAWVATVAVGMRSGLLAALAPRSTLGGPRALHNRVG